MGVDPLLGEISLVPYNFAPRGWAFCNGQMLPISQNTALFSLIGTTYGGDGRTTFALPDLRGRSVVSEGTGPGLPTVTLGSRSGHHKVQLALNNLPSHTHSATFTPGSGTSGSTTADLKVTQGVGNISNPTSAKSIASQVTAGLSTGDSLSTNESTTVIKDAVTGINTGSIDSGSVTIGNMGGSYPFDNRSPSLTLNYIICLQGIFPSRN